LHYKYFGKYIDKVELKAIIDNFGFKKLIFLLFQDYVLNEKSIIQL